ncbi:MAG TPA: wax ester/triacylglycerol synthase family O-acyltransferase [Solirubrobacterales bacterium]|jgi:diacylglycerol O-acyltransferase / wax synthase|nr:wax ester/triacylglycerol synthase family O-acyltransferase [Solirubrobacterales bacterium]
MSTQGRHLDRLTAVDASFLSNESSSSHMHVGAILIFEGPPPRYVDLVEHVRGRLNLVPRFRQKLVVPPLEAGRPLWADDVNFNLSYHIRHTALPEPGGEAQLKRLCGRVFSQQLDRSKPLWELWLVQGLERDRFALLTKTHHAMVDGISGVDIGTVLFDLEPVPAPAPVEERWVPQKSPSTAELVGRGIGDAIGMPIALAGRAVEAVRHPETTARKAVEGVEALSEIVAQFADPAPDVPLNHEIGPHRRYIWARSELATFKRIKDSLGGTVNDVVLAVVTGSIREWLHSRGVRTEGLELRALVPVSIRAEDEHGNLGNRLTAMRGPLPVYIEDPVRRLQVISEEMAGLKESKQALGAEMISRFNDFAPPTLLAQAGRLNFSTRLFNLLVTNVPGPQIPLYVLGRELEEVFPVAFLPQNHRLAVAIMSYHGKIGFGLLADYDSMEDIELLGAGINNALAELEAAASESAAAA